jgi:uncharacterized membrane protein YciS (DUF1049 family)
MAALILILILMVIVAAAAVIFALGNPETISVHFLSWSVKTPMTLVVLVPLAAGLLMGWLLTVPGSIKRGITIAGLKKKVETLEKSLAAQAPAPASKTTEMPKPPAPKPPEPPQPAELTPSEPEQPPAPPKS